MTMLPTRTITFDPGPHTYKDETGAVYTSVTTLIGQVQNEYDAEFWAMYRAIDGEGIYKPRPFPEERMIEVNLAGKRIPLPLEAYYSGAVPLKRKTAEQVTAEWTQLKDEACEWGTAKHEYLEDCIEKFSNTGKVKIHDIQTSMKSNGFAFKVTNVQELENSPLKFTYPTIYAKIEQYIKDGWVAYAEKRIYHPTYFVAGTIDLIFVKGKKFFILDWKTNKEKLKFESGYFQKEWNRTRTKKIKTDKWVSKDTRLKYPLLSIPDCKGMIYTLQLSLYSFLCEQWGLEYVGTILCHIRPYLDDNDEVVLLPNGDRKEHEPEFYKIEYLKGEVKRLLDWKIGLI